MKQSEKIELDDETRDELLTFALEAIEDEFYEEVMTNLSKIEGPEKYYNWYNGYTKIEYPCYYEYGNQLRYEVNTFATSGNISTQYFGQKFDANKVDGNIHMEIWVA